MEQSPRRKMILSLRILQEQIKDEHSVVFLRFQLFGNLLDPTDGVGWLWSQNAHSKSATGGQGQGSTGTLSKEGSSRVYRLLLLCGRCLQLGSRRGEDSSRFHLAKMEGRYRLTDKGQGNKSSKLHAIILVGSSTPIFAQRID